MPVFRFQVSFFISLSFKIKLVLAWIIFYLYYIFFGIIQFYLDTVFGMLFDRDIVYVLRHLDVRFQSVVIPPKDENRATLQNSRQVREVSVKNIL